MNMVQERGNFLIKVASFVFAKGAKEEGM